VSYDQQDIIFPGWVDLLAVERNGRREEGKGTMYACAWLLFPARLDMQDVGGETGMVHSLNTGARELTQGGKQAAFLFVPGHAVHTWTSFPREDVYPAS